MTEFTGYGRGWQEPKAMGWRRIPQRLREPATKTDWKIALAVFVIGYLLFALFLLPA